MPGTNLEVKPSKGISQRRQRCDTGGVGDYGGHRVVLVADHKVGPVAGVVGRCRGEQRGTNGALALLCCLMGEGVRAGW